MYHNEDTTLDLLGQFSQKNGSSKDDTDTNEKIMLRELGQFMSKSDRKGSARLFGIPNFIWYLAMLGLGGYLAKDVWILNQNSTSQHVDVNISSVAQSVTKEIGEVEERVHDALEKFKNEKR